MNKLEICTMIYLASLSLSVTSSTSGTHYVCTLVGCLIEHSPNSCSILSLLAMGPTNLGRSSRMDIRLGKVKGSFIQHSRRVKGSCIQHSRKEAIFKAFSTPMVLTSFSPIGSLRTIKKEMAVITHSSTWYVWPRFNNLCGRRSSGAKAALTFLIAEARIVVISHWVESVNTDIHCSIVSFSYLSMPL